MNDKKTKTYFRNRELFLKIGFSLVTFLDLSSPFFPNLFIGIVFHELVFLFTIGFFITLMQELRNYHRYEYQRNKQNLLIVFAFTVGYHVVYLFFGFFRTQISRLAYSIISPVFMVGLCPFILTIIFVKMKNSQDPLEGISKLDVLMIVSRNQILTQKFTGNLYNSLQWKNLNKNEKKQFQSIFMSDD